MFSIMLQPSENPPVSRPRTPAEAARVVSEADPGNARVVIYGLVTAIELELRLRLTARHALAELGLPAKANEHFQRWIAHLEDCPARLDRSTRALACELALVFMSALRTADLHAALARIAAT